MFRLQTIVWGVMFLARAAVRLAFLVGGADIGEYVVVAFVTGLPVTFAVLAWSIWHAIGNLPPPTGSGGEPVPPAGIEPTPHPA